jgi:PAS domain S-box-containing protein
MQGIKKKLLTSFFAIIILLLISEGFFVTMDYIILSKYTALTNNIVSEYSLIDSTSNLLASYSNRIKAPTDKAEIAKFNTDYSNIQNLLSQLKNDIVDIKSKAAFTSLENNINDVFFNIEIGVNNLASGDYLEAVGRYDAANRSNSFVKENTTDLLLKEIDYAKNLQIGIENVRSISQLIGIILLILTALGCIWYAIYFSNKLITPLDTLTKLAKNIEGGDLSAAVDKKLLTSNDEVSSLANSFNTMVLSLKMNIDKLKEYNKEIKNSRNRLKSEKNKLQKYLDTAGVVVLIFDFNNKVFLINKKGCEILGVKYEDIIGKDWVTEYVTRKNQIQTRSMLAFLMNHTAPADTLENIIIAKDKTEKNIVWHFSILQDENNVAQSVLATGVDITELTKAKITINQLKEVDKLKNEVLNIATHELKTPLISIVGLSEVMEKKPETIPAEYQNFISIIHSEGMKLNNLIKTMLTASRNEVGKISVFKEKFDLVELVKSLETSLNMLTKRSDSKIKFNIKIKNLAIESDKAKVSQVIYNFVDNAVKYGLKGQTIEIGVFLPNEKTVRIEVKGNGQGISKEMQKKLFIKFSQLEPSLSRSQDGMGLGLYICKQNIDNLGGEIGVESEVNKGATFFFTLPLDNKKI